MACLVPAVSSFSFGGHAAAQGRRCEVLDGDTLSCGAERVRIVGLDAPELHGRCPAEKRAALAARERLRVLLSGGFHLLPQGRDRYGRLLAVVRTVDGRDVAGLMIAERLARPYLGIGRREGWCGR